MNEIMQVKIERAIRRAPLLSPSTVRLLELTTVPDPDIDAVIKIVKHDAPLTARLLRVVNSAAFALVKPVTSIHRAVTYLGTRTVVTTALSSSLNDVYNKPLEGYESSGGALWDHSLFCALASRAVALRARTSLPPDLAFTAGLLHDLGKAIISDLLKGSTRDILAGIEKGTMEDYLAAESAAVGKDHAQLGHLLAKQWKLPAPLPEPILYHHRPRRAPAEGELQPLAYAVHLGDVIAMMQGQATGTDSLQYRLDPGYEQHFHLTEDDLAIIVIELTDEFRKLKSSLENI